MNPDFINNAVQVQTFVANLGITPNANYVLVHKRTTGWRAVTAMMFTPNGVDYEQELARREPLSLIIFTGANIVVQSIAAELAPPRTINVAELQEFKYQFITQQYCFHFITRAGQREDYYAFANPLMTPAYTLNNFLELTKNQFYGLNTTDWTAQKRQVLLNPKSTSSSATGKSHANDIPASWRPEREREPFSLRQLLGNKPKHS